MTGPAQRSLVYQALRNLETDNAALRLRLARYEFRQMERELGAKDPFRLDVLTGAGAGQDGSITVPIAIPDIEDITLPRLPVPMGSIHARDTTTDLPIIGVHDDGLTGSHLAAALTGLMTTQYNSPFARLIFVCSSFEAVPFLGRYGFAFDYIGTAAPATALARLYRRYGVTQIRAIATGTVVATYSGP